MRSVVFVAVAASLAACSPQSEEPVAPPPAPAPATVLAGVDLGRPVRLVGNEPFWAIDLTGTEVVYAGVDRPEQRGPQPKPVVQGTVATLNTITTAGTPIVIALTATECSDGMSDRTYPLTALVTVADETLMGCAASTAAIMNAGESGPVVEPAASQPAG
jgi:uncharacterized membrane protein